MEQVRDHLILAPNKKTHLSIRKGKWMYIPAQGGGGWTRTSGHLFSGPAAIAHVGKENSDLQNGKIKKGAPPAQLYDLEADLSQKTNVYNDHPEVVAELQRLLDAAK